MEQHATTYSEAAIFSRMVEAGNDNLSPELARHILSLTISDGDRQRVNELLTRARDGALTESEREELANLNHVADLLSLWQSKARRALKS